MILTLKTIVKLGCVASVLTGLFLSMSTSVSAQTSMSLSVSPTLYDMTAEPGQLWQSSIRVINPNPYPLTVYLDTVNFEPAGETGQPRLLPISNPAMASTTLAGWITVGEDDVTIPAEQTAELSFQIAVPAEAPPGGHFAAVLIGTRPPVNGQQSNQVETSQVVTSLVFLRVTGDINESGSIRSFRTTDRILNEPKATFELRFENTGNVHLLPQGQIEIYNMWGQERGVVPINQTDLYGNVLPNSIREFNFNWTGQWSVADIGRYYAVATVAYGESGRKSATMETAFWVVPWKPLLLVLTVLALFILFVVSVIKWYVRRVLQQVGGGYDLSGRRLTHKPAMARTATADMLDLRQQFRSHTSEAGMFLGAIKTIKDNQRLVFAIVAAVVFTILIVSFFRGAFTDSRSYEVEIVGVDETVTLTSEDIAYEEARSTGEADVHTAVQNSEASNVFEDRAEIQIVNRSGVPGLAAKLRIDLESRGIPVANLGTDLNTVEHNTVIVYDPAYATEALELSRNINDALLSAFTAESENDYPITVYVGTEYLDAVE